MSHSYCRTSVIGWMVVICLLTAAPAAAGSISVTYSGTSSRQVWEDGHGGGGLRLVAPYSGTLAPFGACTLNWTSGGTGGTPTIFTLADGATITGSTTGTFVSADTADIVVTITGGTGIFKGATGTLSGQETVTFSGSIAKGAVFPSAVTLTGTMDVKVVPGSIEVSPSSLMLAVPLGSASPATGVITLKNPGTESVTFQIAASTDAGPNWLRASTAGGTLGPAAVTAVTVSGDPTVGGGLPVGVYSGQVTVRFDGGTVPIKTWLIVGDKGALVASETGLIFSGVAGGEASSAQTIQVSHIGVGDLSGLTAATSVTGGLPNWLSASIRPGADSRHATVSIAITSVPTTVGTYYGSVDLVLHGAANSPVSITIALPVTSEGVDMNEVSTDLSPAAPSAGAQWVTLRTVQFGNLGLNQVTFTIDSTCQDSAGNNYGNFCPSPAPPLDWLAASPDHGTIPPGGAVTVNYQAPASCALPGSSCVVEKMNYRLVRIQVPEDQEVLYDLVALRISNWTNQTNASGAALSLRPSAAATCTPNMLNGGFLTDPWQFQATAGLPHRVQVMVYDDCAQAVNSGSVVAGFSTGEPPIALQPLGDGQWVGTWTPSLASNSANITVTAVVSGSLAGTLTTSGSVAANTATPIVYTGGIVNAASYSTTIAPGAFIAIYGANLAAATTVESGTPFPTTLGNVQVLLGGRPLPLYFVSAGQIDAIVPYDIAPNSTQELIVENGAAVSSPQTVLVGAAEPGVFTLNQSGSGPGSILEQKADGSVTLNSAANPASPGDALMIYCTGLGTVSPAVAAGAAAPLSSLVYSDDTTTVTVGGVNARVLFSGLAPGWVGLYQVNALVPTGVTPGSSVPVLVTTGGSAGAPVTVAVRAQ